MRARLLRSLAGVAALAALAAQWPGPAVAQTKSPPPTLGVQTEALVQGARQARGHRGTFTREQLGARDLIQVEVAEGAVFEFAAYLDATRLDQTPDFRALFDPKEAGATLAAPAQYSETIDELADRFIVDRVIQFELKPDACAGAKSKSQKPTRKGVSPRDGGGFDYCLRSKSGKLSDDLKEGAADVRARLQEQPSNREVADGVTAAEALQLSDEELLRLALDHDGRREVRLLSVVRKSFVPDVEFERFPNYRDPASYARDKAAVRILTPDAFDWSDRMVWIGPNGQPVDRRFVDNERLERVSIPPDIGEITYDTNYFLTGVTLGREFKDRFEFTFAPETFLTDRYFIRFDYNFGAGLGFRVPVAVDATNQPIDRNGRRQLERAVAVRAAPIFAGEGRRAVLPRHLSRRRPQ